jgi:hypothetical protein
MKQENKPPALSPNLEKVHDRFAIWRSRKKIRQPDSKSSCGKLQ